MRRRKTKPADGVPVKPSSARVFKYGLFPPTEQGDRVEEQMWLGHRYFNDLIELELWRRGEWRRILSQDEGVARHEAAEETLVQRLKVERDAIKAKNQAARKRSADAAARGRVHDIQQQLKACRVALKAAKKLARENNQAVAVELEALGVDAAARKKKLRKECKLYWGNYLFTERRVDQACETKRGKPPTDPKFKRWRHDGQVTVQLQKGLAVADALAATDRRFQIDTTLQPVLDRHGKPRKGKHRPRVRLRVGSEGIAPIFAEWPVVMHRPLPPGARIKWATVHRWRVGFNYRWTLHLTLDEVPQTETCGKGAVALDIGWRKRDIDKGSLRATYWRADDGDHGELVMESEVRGGQEKAEDLRSIRDKRQNALAPLMLAWLRANTATLPEWLATELTHMHLWVASGRWHRLENHWRDNRFDGDIEPFELLQAWRKKDRHLGEWEANARRRALERRLDQYRRFAATMARRYDTLILEDFNLSDVARLAEPEDEQKAHKASRSQRQAAAVSTLRLACINAFKTRGGKVVTVSAVNTTLMCHLCKFREAWDAAPDIMHTCSKCHATWDQDDNATHNLLGRWRGVPEVYEEDAAE